MVYIYIIYTFSFFLLLIITIIVFYRPSLLGSVRIEHTDNCTILLGACCTSVYLDSVNNCTIQILSHQLRIHECKDCKLYVQVQSHPIIEDCVSMGFAPYSYKYDSLATDIQVRA